MAQLSHGSTLMLSIDTPIALPRSRHARYAASASCTACPPPSRTLSRESTLQGNTYIVRRQERHQDGAESGHDYEHQQPISPVATESKLCRLHRPYGHYDGGGTVGLAFSVFRIFARVTVRLMAVALVAIWHIVHVGAALLDYISPLDSQTG